MSRPKATKTTIWEGIEQLMQGVTQHWEYKIPVVGTNEHIAVSAKIVIGPHKDGAETHAG